MIHYACKVVKTTDKDLREFEGKALVQKVHDKHQVFTKPHDVISFMLDKEPIAMDQSLITMEKSLAKLKSVKKSHKKVNVKAKESQILADIIKLPDNQMKKSIKTLLKSANKDHSWQRINKHFIFKFSKDDIEEAYEAVENDPEVKSCSEVTKLELTTYILMQKHDFDEESIEYHNFANDTESNRKGMYYIHTF